MHSPLAVTSLMFFFSKGVVNENPSWCQYQSSNIPMVLQWPKTHWACNQRKDNRPYLCCHHHSGGTAMRVLLPLQGVVQGRWDLVWGCFLVPSSTSFYSPWYDAIILPLPLLMPPPFPWNGKTGEMTQTDEDVYSNHHWVADFHTINSRVDLINRMNE